ncbi:hypothetical protein B9Z55_012325 [Caenorhabditis nigoni]|nr:hypothetical protein B9Z55_012325 [Caenorhabditis nigoni]
MTYLNQIGLRFPSVPNREWIVDYNRKKNFIPEFAFDVFGSKVNHYLVLKDSGNVIEDIKQMVEHICEVFRSPICGIDIVEESLIEWIMNFQPTIRYACIRNEVVTSVENLDCIMKSLKVTEHFVLESIGTDKEIRSIEPIPYRSISIFSSYWLTLPAILNGTNYIIRLYDSKLTPKDINTILKEWHKGSKLCNLEYLQIQAYTLPDINSYVEVLEDLNLTGSDGNDGRPMTVKIHDEWTYTLPEVESVHNLIREDGMIGSVFPSVTMNEENGEIIDVFFNFQVWSKQA